MNEHQRWEQQEKKALQALGLFSDTGTWRKYSNYIIDSDKDGLPLIVPGKNSSKTVYNPFNEMPYILHDFLVLLKDTNTIINGIHIHPEYKEAKVIWKEEDKRCLFHLAEKVLPFCNKYGLFGTYENGMIGIYGTRHGNNVQTVDGWNYMVQVKDSITSEMDFKTYISFYTTGQSTIPDPTYKNMDELYKHIGDSVFALYGVLLEYYSLIDTWTVFKQNSYSVEDEYRPGEGWKYNNNEMMKWKHILQSDTSVYDIGLGIYFHNGKQQLAWKYKSLLEALKIMYIYDLTFDANHIEFCHFKPCGRPFIAKTKTQICCSPECNNALRQQRLRDKNKAKKLIRQGLSIEEIAQVIRTSPGQITKWLHEE